jgi:large subunit ribosomal protein L6
MPKGVTLSVDNYNVVKVKGPKGELVQAVDPDITVKMEDDNVLVTRPSDQKRHKAMHGLYRSLIHNMIFGVSTGYTTKMELVGVGYRAAATGNQLELTIGYTHPVLFILPKEMKVTAAQEKGQNPIITLECHDKQLLGQVAAKIRSMRKPEPYKGKGIKFVGEVLRRKAGKSASSK